METWISIVIILEIIVFLFILYGCVTPSFKQKLIDFEDRTILKIKEKFRK